ncbi:efflux RND transporter permease subunit [Roseimicrobium sp. ORNL1]|uniref:efflux RND transporter permease subunit n=1 Tax=Roseimicrobium sp. ORNL1 TaxID=2711231 RepID=UPI0013E0EE5B|nr:efflux RND transporter permease subunit [Roseimicrobium sp. ORNL1]QIF03823.1 efflux RND transporter permease subunit [Roseimicrobium sp. ORNL1]
MLNALVSASLRFRVLVLLGATLLLVFGLQSVRHAPLDVFPEFAPPLAEVQTEAPGLSTEEVDALVTVPLENALNGLPWLKTVRSKSVLGLSSIVLIFTDGTDVLRARQMITERLGQVQSRLPAAMRPPVLLSPHSSLSRVMKIGLTSPKLSQQDLSELALWTIRPRLMAVPGVANVAIWGQRDKQYQVHVDPEKLRALGVTLDAVMKAAGDAATVAPGGFLDTPNQRLAIRDSGGIQHIDDLANTLLESRNGAPIRLRDVAEVRIGHPPAIGDAIINDVPGLLLIVEKQPWGNTLDVTRGVEQALETLKPGLPDVAIDSRIFRPATFIETSLDNLSHALWLGCGFVVLVLLVFLFDLRTAFISLTAIPLSLLAAVLVLRAFGETLNTMVIAGLVIALGEVVDDAIIDVENIHRRLRLNAQLDRPRSLFTVVLRASLEVRSAVVYASLIVVLVMLPVFFLDGLAGSFFRPLALAYVLSILASLVVALTVTPALSFMMLGKHSKKPRENPLLRGLQGLYGSILPFFMARPRFWFAAVLAAIVGAGFMATKLGEEFLPNFRERDFLMHWVEKPATSLEAMTRITVQASRELRSVPGVNNFGSHIARAELGDEVVGPNFTELWISLDPSADYDTSLHKIQGIVDGYPGLYRDVQTYLRERVKEVLTGASASIVVRLYGPDLEVLRSKAGEVFDAIRKIDGVATLKIEPQSLVPQVRVKVRPEIASAFGVTAGQVRKAMSVFVKGQKVGEVFTDQKVHEVTVWGAPEVRADISAINALLIDTTSGGHVRLGDVAEVTVVPTPNEIKRESASRRLDVTCNASGRDLGAVAREVQEKVSKLSFPAGYHPEFLGEDAARRESKQRILWLSIASLVGVLALLQADFQSGRLTMLLALTLPFALIGGVLAVWWTGGILSLGSLVGFVTVLGIAARNGIMLLSHYQHLMEKEGMAFGPELIIRGARERLSPILMTAACAGLALVPLAWKGNVPGHEIEHPMAVVILGGLVTSTLLNLLLLPALFGWLGRKSAAEASG